jgi:hypothetical protein
MFPYKGGVIMRIWNSRIVLFVLLFVGSFIVGCSTFGKPVEDLKIVEGQIDNVVLSEVANKKDFLSVTHVGFVNGQGISLVGTYPGLSKGKTVKLKLRFYKVIRGTPYYEQLDISTGGQPEQKQPQEMKQTGAPEASVK